VEGTRRQSDENGFTLVELIIYMSLALVVLVVVGGLLASSMNASNTASAAAQSSTDGQLTAQSVEDGIRGSSGFQLSTVNGNDQLLIAPTIQGSSAVTWACSAWYYSAVDGSIRHTVSTARIAIPTAAAVAGWTLLDASVRPTSGAAVFSQNGQELKMSFTSLDDKTPGEEITSSALARAGQAGITCW
jgi:type II secretory pathway pseudopilin PulG